MINPLNRIGIDPLSLARSAGEPARRTAASDQSAASSGSSEEAFTESAPTDTGALASKQTFLTLLVAQIKNQNPLNPADGTEFLSQLAQFSELEQLISIRQELEAIGEGGTQRDSAPESGS